MDKLTRITLELFVEKAERLTKYVRENHALNSVIVNPGGLVGIFRNSEEEEWQIASTLDGFLVTFRMFVQPRDRIALYSLKRDSHRQLLRQKPKLLDLTGLSLSWYEKVEQAYTLIDTTLATPLPNLVYNNIPITRREILETFLYGDGVHINAANREIFNQWRHSTTLFGGLQLEFVTILGLIFGQILEVAEFGKRELLYIA